jgi:HSP20 family protein
MLMRKKEAELAPRGGPRDPFGLFRQMTADFDQLFGEPFLRWPFRTPLLEGAATYVPEIDVFEKDNRLVTRIDLPGMNKEDVKVEISDGWLVVSGERKAEAEETKEKFYRCERSYGSFSRAIPLPEGARAEDVKAAFSAGVLEVSVPMPARMTSRPQSIPIEEPVAAAKKPAA